MKHKTAGTTGRLLAIAVVLSLSACAAPVAPTTAPAAPTAAVAAPTAAPAAATEVEMFDCSKFKKDPPWTIANSSQGRTNSWQIMHDGYFELAAETTYKGQIKELLYADANGNADKQISDIEDLITKKRIF
jgi:ABC-type sugar transport system substrate-binding protein